MALTNPSTTYLGSGEGSKSLWVLGELVTYKVTAEQTGGAYSLFEVVTRPGDSPPPHVQHQEDECFYVLEGEFEFLNNGYVVGVSTGSLVYVPRGNLHTYKNVGSEPGRMLVSQTPGGLHERFFEELGEEAQDSTTPPAMDGPLDTERIVAIAARYGIEMPPHKLDNRYPMHNDKQEVFPMITEKGSSVREFVKGFHGEVVLPKDEGYDEVRKVFNGMIDRRPALIARCVDTQDVVRAVRFAREHDLLVSVRGGGHSVAGHGVCEGGLMIDLSLMKDVEVDAKNRVAKAQPGLRLGEFIVETEKYGLVSPTGTVSDTGLAGLTLGGGYGYLSGKYGLALDNLLAAEVVTADGRVLRASADEHPDLHWALRGGSGNFGIVTSFELKLHPVTQVLGGMLIHPFERAGEVLRFYREVAASAPDELTIYAALVTTPDGQQAVAILPCYCGPIEEGERILAPIRAFGPPIADLIRPMKYSEMNTLVDAANPSGMQNYWKGNLMHELSDGAIDVIVEHAARVPSPLSIILIDQLHGAASRVPPSEAAFAHRDTRHNVMTMSMWEDQADAEVNIAWTRGLSAAIEPFATGTVYVNGAYEQRPLAAYGTNHDRLVEVKTAYDPTNFFRHNQNIRPKDRAA